eukprot:scaffold595735_cov15-Prasinocladus_malaysianus.AAC.1
MAVIGVIVLVAGAVTSVEVCRCRRLELLSSSAASDIYANNTIPPGEIYVVDAKLCVAAHRCHSKAAETDTDGDFDVAGGLIFGMIMSLCLVAYVVVIGAAITTDMPMPRLCESRYCL